MRNLLLSIGLILLASAAPLPAVDGTWRSLGPDGGSVSDVAIHPGNPQVMYASVSGGVFKSRDGGATWTWTGEGLDAGSPTFNVAFDPVQPATVYVGQGAGVFKSVDGGLSWTNTGCPATNRIAVHPRVSGRVFAATQLGLFRSSNGGAAWTRLTHGLPESYGATLIAFDPSSERRLYASVQDIVTQEGGLFRSTDGGVNWQPLHSGPLEDRRIYSLAVDPRAPATLYASTGDAVFKSTNGGTAWRPAGGLAAAGIVWTLQAHPRLSGVVYAGTEAGLFRSQDGGATWARVSRGLPAHQSVPALAFSPSSAQTLFAGMAGVFGRGGVFKSANGGRSWTLSSRGLSALSVGSIAVDPENPDTLWVLGSTVPFRSTDRGRTWVQVRPGTGDGDTLVSGLAINPADGDNVYLVFLDDTVRRTRDGGRTWEAAGNLGAVASYARVAFDPQTPSTHYVAGRGMTRSTDGGNHWAPLPGETSDMVFYDLAISPSSPSTLYGSGAFNGDPRVIRTTDGGATWTQVQQGLPNSFNFLVVDPLVPSTVYGTVYGKVYKTVNGGGSWSVFSDAFSHRSVLPLAISPFASGLLYVGVYGDNVYEIQDGGGTWEPLGNNPFKTGYGAPAVDPHDPCRIYTGSGRGLLVFTKRGTAECD